MSRNEFTANTEMQQTAEFNNMARLNRTKANLMRQKHWREAREARNSTVVGRVARFFKG